MTKGATMTFEPDPVTLDGREIAQKIWELVNSEAPNELVMIWLGIACARLFDYQKKLEALGELPAK
jgi:hypothetical protein